MIWRCEQTNNPVGTDTVMIGAKPCGCRGCRGASLEAENRRLREALEKIAAPTYGTELWNTHKERAKIYWRHLISFQTIARAALKERHEG